MFLLSRRLQIFTTYKPLSWLTSISHSVFPLLAPPSFSSSSLDDEDTEKYHSFTVAYLVNSCGLSPKCAISSSEKVQFQNTMKPDSVLALLRAHEFSETQISRFVAKQPKLLLAKPEKSLLPKLEFFYSKGFSKNDMARDLSLRPYVLGRSLKRYIVPNYDLLISVLHSQEQVLSALMTRRPSLEKHWGNVAANIGSLRGLRFSHSFIGSMLRNNPQVLVAEHGRFLELVSKVEAMGFYPDTETFRMAMHVFSSEALERRWRQNYEVYRLWGWSEDDILGAFRYNPSCMSLSDAKITKMMNFLVNDMGLPSEKIARIPTVLNYSFEKRVFPRCLVVKVLLSKGLIEQRNINLVPILNCVEKRFLVNFVTKYVHQVPRLLDVYRGTVNPNDA